MDTTDDKREECTHEVSGCIDPFQDECAMALVKNSKLAADGVRGAARPAVPPDPHTATRPVARARGALADARADKVSERLAAATEELASGLAEAAAAAEELSRAMEEIAAGAEEAAGSSQEQLAAIKSVRPRLRLHRGQRRPVRNAYLDIRHPA